MYLSVNQKSNFNFYIKHRIKPYFIATVFCIVFSYIYSKFSHGVSSVHMTYLFMYPLCFGVVCSLILSSSKDVRTMKFFATHFYHTGVIALTLSSALNGIFEIAGTSSLYQSTLSIVSVLMILIGVLCFVFNK
ncbi:MAG: hypothetical protein R3Y09_09190 [Clostridia bacterium]